MLSKVNAILLPLALAAGMVGVIVAPTSPVLGQTPTPVIFVPLKLVLPDPLTNPLNQPFGQELVRRLRLPNFCSWDTCIGLRDMLGNTATPASTPTITQTRTITSTPTQTSTATRTATATSTNTSASTATNTSTSTSTSTSTATATNTATFTSTPTSTGTPTVTQTPTATFTFTPATYWSIFIPSSGDTIVAEIPNDTATFTCSPPLECIGTAATDTIVFQIQTFTPTGTFTATRTFTQTPTWTATATGTVTSTPTSTPTPTATPTGLTYWSIFAPSSGANIVAEIAADTATFTATSPLVITGVAVSDTLNYTWDFSVANTWTGLQTFDAGIKLNDNDTAAFGDSSDALISFDNSNLIINPDPVTTTAGLKYQSLNSVEFGDGGGTCSGTTCTTALTLTDALTWDVGGFNGLAALSSSRTVTWEQDNFLSLFFSTADTWTNPAGEARSFGGVWLFNDSMTINANATSFAQTATGYISFKSTPTFSKTGANSFTISTFAGASIQPTFNSGVTATTISGLNVLSYGGAGTVTNQTGLNIADLTGATNNWSMQVGTAKSSHAGPITFGAAAAPCTSCGIELQSTTTALLLSRMTTTQRDALTAVDGMRIYNSTKALFENRQNGSWVNDVQSVETSVTLTDTGYYSTTVTGQTWVAVASEIVCQPFGSTTNGLTPEVVAISSLAVSVSDRVAGTGFNVNVFNPYGTTGIVQIHCIGV